MRLTLIKTALAALVMAVGMQTPSVAGDRDNFIVGGVPVADINELPWQVALLSGTSTAPFQFCGGSIIAPQWILTAAHCVEGRTPAQIDVLAGTVYKFSGGVRTDSIAIFTHPNWGQTTLQYDFDAALIKLSEPLTVGAPIPLATAATPLPVDFPVRVSGWGATTEGGSTSPQLLRVDVPVVSNDTCKGSYGDIISENMVCLGVAAGGIDSCQGDSGGPAAVIESGTTPTTGTLVGIVSWGWGCAQPNNFGVYTRVSTVTDWVDATIAANP